MRLRRDSPRLPGIAKLDIAFPNDAVGTVNITGKLGATPEPGYDSDQLRIYRSIGGDNWGPGIPGRPKLGIHVAAKNKATQQFQIFHQYWGYWEGDQPIAVNGQVPDFFPYILSMKSGSQFEISCRLPDSWDFGYGYVCDLQDVTLAN